MQAMVFMFNGAMDKDKTKTIMGLIVESLREGLGMSRYVLAKEAGGGYSWLRRFEKQLCRDAVQSGSAFE